VRRFIAKLLSCFNKFWFIAMDAAAGAGKTLQINM
jgi:hypothetical protein